MNSKTVLSNALLVVVFFSRIPTCFGDSYAEYSPKIEYSKSGATFAIVRESEVKGGCEITVATRRNGDDAGVAFAIENSARNGEIRFIRKLALEFQPAVVQLTDKYLILIDFYGSNAQLVKSTSIVRFYDLESGLSEPVKAFQLADFPWERRPASNGSKIHWMRDAWLAEEQTQLVIIPPNAKTTELEVSEIAFFVIDVRTFQLQSSRNFQDLVALTGKRDLPSLIRIASDHAILDSQFKKQVQELVAERSNSLGSRATGAAYLWRHFRDIESRSLLVNCARLGRRADDSDTPVASDRFLLCRLEDNPIWIANSALESELEEGSPKPP